MSMQNVSDAAYWHSKALDITEELIKLRNRTEKYATDLRTANMEVANLSETINKQQKVIERVKEHAVSGWLASHSDMASFRKYFNAILAAIDERERNNHA